MIYITANYSGRDMGSIMADIREGLHNVPVPRDFSIGFGGDFDEQQKAFYELMTSFCPGPGAGLYGYGFIV